MAEKKAESKEQQKVAYVVAAEFHDKDDFSKVYKVGDELKDFDEARLASLLDRKLVKKA